jgi:hypothetical protein
LCAPLPAAAPSIPPPSPNDSEDQSVPVDLSTKAHLQFSKYLAEVTRDFFPEVNDAGASQGGEASEEMENEEEVEEEEEEVEQQHEERDEEESPGFSPEVAKYFSLDDLKLLARAKSERSASALYFTHRVNYGKYLASKLNKYPVIVRLVLASGVATLSEGFCERVFSAGKLIQSRTRTKLGMKKLEAQTCSRINREFIRFEREQKEKKKKRKRGGIGLRG